MSNTLTTILTDQTARDISVVESALMQEAEIAGPWFDAAEL